MNHARSICHPTLFKRWMCRHLYEHVCIIWMEKVWKWSLIWTHYTMGPYYNRLSTRRDIKWSSFTEFSCVFFLFSRYFLYSITFIETKRDQKKMKEKIQSTSLHSMALVHSTTLVTITTTQKPICNKLWFSYWKRYTKCAYRLKKYQPYSAHKVHMLSVKWPKSWAVNWYKSYKTSRKVK